MANILSACRGKKVPGHDRERRMTDISMDAGGGTAETRKLRFAVIVPVLDAEREAPAFIAALQRQTLAPDIFLVIDSSSADRSVEIFKNAGAMVHVIPRAEFNHADTRQMALDMAVQMARDVEIAVFLTQDAVLAGEGSLKSMLAAFADPAIGIAYGRQFRVRAPMPWKAMCAFSTIPANRKFARSRTARDTASAPAFFPTPMPLIASSL